MSRTNDITVIIGRKNSGKSTVARELVAGRSRRIVVDPMWEHEELGAIVERFDDLVAYLRRSRFGPYALVLRTMDDGERDRVIELAVAGTPHAPPLPGVTLMIDEIDRMCSPSSIPPGLRRAVNYGRHFGVSLVAISRRPRQMHRDITAMADTIIVGQTQEPADLEYLAQFIGPELSARARELRDFEFLRWPDDLAAEPETTPDVRPKTEPETLPVAEKVMVDSGAGAPPGSPDT